MPSLPNKRRRRLGAAAVASFLFAVSAASAGASPQDGPAQPKGGAESQPALSAPAPGGRPLADAAQRPQNETPAAARSASGEPKGAGGQKTLGDEKAGNGAAPKTDKTDKTDKADKTGSAAAAADAALPDAAPGAKAAGLRPDGEKERAGEEPAVDCSNIVGKDADDALRLAIQCISSAEKAENKLADYRNAKPLFDMDALFAAAGANFDAVNKLIRPIDGPAKQDGEALMRRHYVALATFLTAESSLDDAGPDSINSALKTYAELERRQPSDTLYERMAELSVANLNMEAAREIIDRWIAFNPKPLYPRELLQWTMRLVDPKERDSFGEFRRLLAKAPDDDAKERLYLIASEMATRQGDALKRLAPAMAKECSRAKDSYPAALCYLVYANLAGDKKATVAALKRVYKLDANLDLGTLQVFDHVFQSNKEAVDQFFREIDVPDDPTWLKLYVGYGAHTQNERMLVEALTKRADIAKTNPAANIQMGMAVFPQDPKKAIRYFENAWESIEDETLKNQTALTIVMAALSRETRDELKKWVAILPESAFPYEKRFALTVLADIDGDEEAFDKAYAKLKATPRPKDSYVSQEQAALMDVSAAMRMQDANKALGILNAALKTERDRRQPDPTMLTVILQSRALTLTDKLGRHEEAIKDLKELLKFAKDKGQALNSLGYTQLFVKDQREEGARHIEQALKLLPDSPEVQDSMALAWIFQGKADKAIPLLERSLSKLNNPEVRAHLAEAKFIAGQTAEAQKLLRQARAEDPNNREVRRIMSERFPELAQEPIEPKAKTGQADSAGQNAKGAEEAEDAKGSQGPKAPASVQDGTDPQKAQNGQPAQAAKTAAEPRNDKGKAAQNAQGAQPNNSAEPAH